MKKINEKNFELIYTGGGFYIAQYSEDGFIWSTSNEMPHCLTKYVDRGDDTYYEENIVWSVDVDESIPTKRDELIYLTLFDMMKDEGIVQDDEDLTSIMVDLNMDELYILSAALHNNLLFIDQSVSPEWTHKLKKMEKKIDKFETNLRKKINSR